MWPNVSAETDARPAIGSEDAGQTRLAGIDHVGISPLAGHEIGTLAVGRVTGGVWTAASLSADIVRPLSLPAALITVAPLSTAVIEAGLSDVVLTKAESGPLPAFGPKTRLQTARLPTASAF